MDLDDETLELLGGSRTWEERIDLGKRTVMTKRPGGFDAKANRDKRRDAINARARALAAERQRRFDARWSSGSFTPRRKSKSNA